MTTADPHTWATAERVCTPQQLRALELRDRHGLSQRTIALTLGVSRERVRQLLDRAEQKIAEQLDRDRAA